MIHRAALIVISILLLLLLVACNYKSPIMCDLHQTEAEAFELATDTGELYRFRVMQTTASIGPGMSYQCTASSFYADTGWEVVARGLINMPQDARIIGFARITASGIDLHDREFDFSDQIAFFYVTDSWQGEGRLPPSFNLLDSDIVCGWGLVDWQIGGLKAIQSTSIDELNSFEVADTGLGFRVLPRAGGWWLATDIEEEAKPTANNP